MTDFRRRVRAAPGPLAGGARAPRSARSRSCRAGRRSRPVGSRLPLDYARETGANFVTAGRARRRAGADVVRRGRTRASTTSGCGPTCCGRRRWRSTCSATSPPTSERADRAVHTWWPDTPGTVTEVRFAHSPGRFDPTYLNSLRAFDAAFVLDLGDGTQRHHRRRHQVPRLAQAGDPEAERTAARNLEVAERSGAFARRRDRRSSTGRSPLAVMWLEHLLLLSMLQHPSGAWAWGRYVVVHPAGNVDVVAGCDRYRGLLADHVDLRDDDDRGRCSTATPCRRRPRRRCGRGSHPAARAALPGPRTRR